MTSLATFESFAPRAVNYLVSFGRYKRSGINRPRERPGRSRSASADQGGLDRYALGATGNPFAIR